MKRSILLLRPSCWRSLRRLSSGGRLNKAMWWCDQLDSRAWIAAAKSNDMNAVFLESYGAPHEALVCAQIARPKPLPHELLIKVSTIGVNPLDCDVRRGYGRSLLEHTRPLPAIIGQELCGTVEAVGEHVLNYRPGDAVWASLSPVRGGAYAEYVCVSPAEVSHRPPSLSAREAAALPFVGTTVWAALGDTAQLFESASSSSSALPADSPLAGPAGFLSWLSRGGVHLLSPVAMAALNTLGRQGPSSSLLGSLLPSVNDPRTWKAVSECLSGLATAVPQHVSGALQGVKGRVRKEEGKEGEEKEEGKAGAEAASLGVLRARKGKEGAVVFIDGASGALGAVAVQLLTHLGYRVWATGGASSVDRLRSLGCERVWQYGADGTEAPSYMEELAQTQEVDVYLDARGGDRSEAEWEADEGRALNILKPETGHFLTLRGPLLRLADQYGAVQGLSLGLKDLADKKRHLRQQYGIRYDWVLNYPSHEALAQLAALSEAGIIRPLMDKQPLEGLNSIADAHVLMEARQARGKLVVEL